MAGGRARRAGIVLRWPLGMALAAWRYMWRTTPLHRRDQIESGDASEPPLPEQRADQTLQRSADGVGPLYRRRYWVDVEDAALSAAEVIDAIAEEPNLLAPIEVAVFSKVTAPQRALRPGDEMVVRMPGPWDGPVRVLDRTPTSLRLATLRGHLEAGQIEFRALPRDHGMRFEIESWTRSGDRLSSFLYNRARLVKEMQMHMWTHSCERVAKLAGGRLRDGVHVHTAQIAGSARS